MSEAQTVVPLPVPATRYPGVGPRAIATVIDAIVGFVVIGVPLLLLFGKQTTVSSNGGTTTTHSTSDPKVLALWLVLAVAYYVAFEGTVGATPGKFLLGLRVRSASGEKCSPRQAVIRNVLRVVDCFPYFVPYLVAAIAAWTDNSFQHDQAPVAGHPRRRVGDRAAGTIVTYR